MKQVRLSYRHSGYVVEPPIRTLRDKDNGQTKMHQLDICV